MNTAEEKLTERKVTYSLELDGKFYIVENVPARVNEETGEQYFAPETVEHLQKKIRGNALPKRTLETPVFDYMD
ncbi:MAG: YgiT-type zinc finger protein [Bacteroidota bacterium]